MLTELLNMFELMIVDDQLLSKFLENADSAVKVD